MAHAPVTNYIELLYAALRSPCGVVVASDDPARLRQRLYSARKDFADEDLKRLSFVESPTNPSGELWIVKHAARE